MGTMISERIKSDIRAKRRNETENGSGLSGRLHRLFPLVTRQLEWPVSGLSGSGHSAGALLVVLLLCGWVVMTGCQNDSRPAADPALDERPDVPRTVSITIDDLPAGSRTLDLGERRQITDGLLDKVTRYEVPAVGFVIERLLYNSGELQPEEVELLELWLEAGLELANHTHSHIRFDTTPMEEYQEDIMRGEEVTRPLMEEYGMELRYFRHPFLNYGDDLQRREELNRFLDEQDYTVAPVTVDSRDWYYNRAYVNALRMGDDELAQQIADDYIRYTEEVFRHSEAVTRKVLGREPAQILLLHAIRLNADHFDRVAAVIRDLGYEFVTLEEALEDPLYRDGDTSHHPSTLNAFNDHWEQQTGEELPRRPDVPEWVSHARELASE